jgi:hypothetical protein
LRPGEHVEQLGGPPAELLAGADEMGQRGPGQKHRTGRVEALWIDGRNGSAGGAEQCECPADDQTGQAGVEGGGADAVVDRRHSGAAGERANLLAEPGGILGV